MTTEKVATTSGWRRAANTEMHRMDSEKNADREMGHKGGNHVSNSKSLDTNISQH